MNQGDEEAEGIVNGDLFVLLADDILILILTMLGCDLKFLCHCRLVSKRFASVIPLISSVTLSIPALLDKFSPKLLQAQVTYAFNALKNFRNIRSLHIEFIEEKYRGLNLQWKAVFGSMTCTCMCLVFDSITNSSSSSASATATATAAEDQVDTLAIDGPINWRLVYPNLWRNHLASAHPMVESVVITDSKKQGKVCFGNSELRDARICSDVLDLWYNRWPEGRTSLKVFKVEELRLPKSGFLMKGVSLVISKIGEKSPEDHKYDDMLNCDFGEEEKVFGEALNLILRIPKEKMIGRSQYASGIYVSLLRII